MNNILKTFVIVIFTVCAIYLGIGYLSSYIGWYGYKKWTYRVGTNNIQEAKERGIFVKELNFTVENYSGDLHGFIPFIAKGFKYGHHSSIETVELTDTNYPFDLCFNYKRSSRFGVLIKVQEFSKFDSSDAVNGFLKFPELTDTISLTIVGDSIKTGTIKVW